MAGGGCITIAAVDGTEFDVDAAGIWRITHRADDSDGASPTVVDHDGGEQETGESVARLLTALAAEAVVLVRLTAPDGAAVYLKPDAVTAVQPAIPETDTPGALAAITVAGVRQLVVETPAEVMLALGVEHPSAQQDTEVSPPAG